MAAPHILPSALGTASASVTSKLSRLNIPPHTIAVYASWSPSPAGHATLATGRVLALTRTGLSPAGPDQLVLAHPQDFACSLSAGASVLMALGFVVAMITYGTGRTNLLSGIVHLVLLAAYVFTVFAP
jgi:Ca2+/H+ antiporter